ncbi:hypothetical protein O987_06035 [Comamonas testosteroni TK102]|uniref:Uncharacterized protein n=1 Tax=Comamonas testosteroni TK102 TaxID=1392005 RepID=A0A076PKY2_COMTE|nr:hypothetical protein O987_06035 [Comamonas testosteroni TK102]
MCRIFDSSMATRDCLVPPSSTVARAVFLAVLKGGSTAGQSFTAQGSGRKF